MKTLQKVFPKYSIALGVLFVITVFFLITRGNTVDIEAGEVTNAELVQAIYATGFVEAESIANLNTEFSGTVSYIGAKEGEPVKRGQNIISFSSPQPQFAVSEARSSVAEQDAQARESRAQLKRKKNLYHEGAISRQDLDEAEKKSVQADELLQQKALQLKMRQDDLNKLSVKAPFDGVLTLQNVKEGDYIPVGTLVARVVDPAGYLINVEVDELDIPRIRNGQKATVVFDAYPDQRLSAVVSRIVPQTDKITKTSKIYLTIDKPAGTIQSGMTATANIIYNVKQNALLVRKSSVFEENHQNYVWKIEKGRLKKQPIRQGASDLTFVEVLLGLKKGDKVVLVPDKGLHEGMDVRIVRAGKS
ncbi:efflux RND transporter periplasmic adaptor subunit [Chlorobium sp. BLA1]|uniref:efflux RND transporter periplasmic adaptor subunit n=1 Tax=Candidatus Chlorobium masyuteum TaxID=2716876 RepID=UPI0014213458|nr:efflux RND transporter periplasmic adaptor subunit [Candidatus Chlorobium masyuteum]NHQ59297.1 efflux RND transporter periplasmic adaptor subunit [Candidatus Chlorobium masyuteum]